MVQSSFLANGKGDGMVQSSFLANGEGDVMVQSSSASMGMGWCRVAFWPMVRAM